MDTVELDPTILREYDIRGIVGHNFTPNVAMSLARAFGMEVVRAFGDNCTVVVGRDGRLSSTEISKSVIDGLVSTGVNVIDVGLGPTPLIYFGCYELSANAGIVITGSHNPENYNGMKLVLDNKPFFGKDIQNLGLNLAENSVVESPGRVSEKDISDWYIDRLLYRNKIPSDIKVVWDPGNGSSGQIVSKMVSRMNGNHKVINSEIDGSFPNHHPDPTVRENLEQLAREVVEGNFDLGIAFDGDGDRIGVVDSLGRALWGDQLMILWAREILKNKPGSTIIADVKISQVLVDEVKTAGGELLIWKTGHSFIKKKMAEICSPLGGEMSGHIFFADQYYGFDDALYASIRLLGVLGDTGIPLADFLDSLPETYNTPEVRFECDDREKHSIVEKIKNKYMKNLKGTLIDIDGIRLETDKGWWVLRASNTQPAIVARCEAKSLKGLESIVNQLIKDLEEQGIDVSNSFNSS